MKTMKNVAIVIGCNVSLLPLAMMVLVTSWPEYWMKKITGPLRKNVVVKNTITSLCTVSFLFCLTMIQCLLGKLALASTNWYIQTLKYFNGQIGD